MHKHYIASIFKSLRKDHVQLAIHYIQLLLNHYLPADLIQMYKINTVDIKTSFNKNSTRFTDTIEQLQQHKSQEQLTIISLNNAIATSICQDK